MALGNILAQGTYSNLQNINYCKQMKLLGFQLVVYESDQKEGEKTRMQFTFMNKQTMPEGGGDPIVDLIFDDNFGIANIGGADNNLLKAIYTYLKSLPEFSGATDC